MQFTTLALAALASIASAQKVIVVTVGLNGTLTYSPSNVVATAGDMVQFQFTAGNHTATQSTFDQPCQPISQHAASAGFHSGFQPAAASAAQGMIPTYTITINDTKPIWVYCAQGKHCESGMVMVINENTTANASRSLSAFAALAKTATTTLPGSSTSGGTNSSTTTSGGSTSSSTTAASSSAMSVAAPSLFSLLGVAAALFLL